MLAHHTWLQPAPRLACGVFDYDCTSDPPQFSWRAVAASAVAAGIGQAVGGALNSNTSAFGPVQPAFSSFGDVGGAFARGAVSGLAAGFTASAVMAKGGKVDITRVAVDAFGQSLANSIAGQIGQAGQQEGKAPQTQGQGPWSDYNYENGADIADSIARQQARAGFIQAGRDTMGPESGVWGAQAGFANEAALQNQENMRDRGMAGLMGLGSSADSTQPRNRTAARGDSWARMARQEYGDERYALALAQANGARSTNLPLGANVQLPDLTGANLRQGGSFIAADAAMRVPRHAVEAGVNQADTQASSVVSFGDQRDTKDIRFGFASESNSIAKRVPILSNAAGEFASKANQAYSSGDKVQGDKYLQIAADYYREAGDAQQSANNRSMAAYKFQLPAAAPGTPGRELAFEVKLGGAAYFGLGGNFELTGNLNLSRPFASGITEFEAGFGPGVGFKAKGGFEWLKDPELGAAAPIKLFNSLGSGQADNTGAISTKFSAEAAVPFLTVTGLEMRGGVQSPLNGVPATDKNFGGFGEIKYLEPKVSPFLNIGASIKWDWFNTSYKKSSSGGQ